MPALIETVELVSKTMNELIDFAVEDEFISCEFENYLTENNVQLEKQSQISEVLTNYVIQGRVSTGKPVLDYFFEKNPKCDSKIISAIKNSFVSVFKINKICKNSFEVTCLASLRDYVLLMLVKTSSLRGVGLYDFIEARVIEIEGNFYILEINNVISSYKEYLANTRAVVNIIKNPEIAFLPDNFKLQIESFAMSFNEIFKTDEIIVSNREIDRVLDDFYLFHTGKKDKVDFISYKSNLKYFEIKEFENNFIINASKGFGSTEETYDIGLFCDRQKGLFVIPFLGTLNAILSGEKVENAALCIKYFLTSNKAPAGLLRKKNEPFLKAVNFYLGANFSDIEEIIAQYKPKNTYSPVNVLFESDVFAKVLGYKQTAKDKTIGRNEPCPCGSGKKYKHCCLNK